MPHSKHGQLLENKYLVSTSSHSERATLQVSYKYAEQIALGISSNIGIGLGNLSYSHFPYERVEEGGGGGEESLLYPLLLKSQKTHNPCVHGPELNAWRRDGLTLPQAV